MKIKLTPTQILTVYQAAVTLRALPALPLDLANKINGLSVAVTPAKNKMQESSELIDEKRISNSKISNEDDKRKANIQLQEDILKENRKSFDVEFTPLKTSDFKGYEITGEKEVQTQNGVMKYNYRDAYFELISNGFIAE